MSFEVDGLLPREVARPSDAADVATILSDLHSQSVAVIPWGGGTRMGVGNTPRDYDVALDLTGVSQNIEHVAGDMTVVCDAGVRISDLTDLLGESNQRLPFTIPRPERATIGGSVASNASSLLRPRFGGIRDWIIGLHVVLADGTPTKSGGRVVKNVQGYDLHRLHTGAFGTLGVITSVALKLVPLPERTRTVAMWFDRFGPAADAAREIGQLELTVESARLYSGSRSAGAIRELATSRYMDADVGIESATHLMLVKVSGSVAALNRQIEDLIGLAGTVPATGYESLDGAQETDLWDYLEQPNLEAKLSLRIATTAIDSAALVDRLRRWLERQQANGDLWSAIDVGYGSLMLNFADIDDHIASALISETTKQVRDVSGSVLIERCPISIKKSVDVFGIDPSASQIMKNMKHEFDPGQILNPGRFAFRI